MAKPVTEAALKFWILELLAEDSTRQWFDLEKFFMGELRSGRLRSRCPVQTGEAQRRSV